MKYRVQLVKDNTYEVIQDTIEYNAVRSESIFQGSLSDCESFIRLREKGQI